jgi:hypothetical protein
MPIDFNWERRCKLTINGATKVSGSHTDYTVILNHQAIPSEALDADGSNRANLDGSDIRFALDTAGLNELARDINLWTPDNNPANGRALIEVKIPSLLNIQKDIYMFYKNSGASDYARTHTYGRNNAYDSYHEFFLPLIETGNGTSNEFVDRTVNDRHGTGGGGDSAKTPDKYNLILGVAGQDFISSNTDHITLADMEIIGSRTIEGCMNPDDTTYGTLFYIGNSNGSVVDAFIQKNVTTNYLQHFIDTGTSYTSTSGMSTGTTYHYMSSWNSSTNAVVHYLNGAAVGSSTISPEGNYGTRPTYIGSMPAATYFNKFEGKIAIVAYHSIDRSSGWNITRDNNLRDITNFITVGTPTGFSAENVFADLIY